MSIRLPGGRRNNQRDRRRELHRVRHHILISSSSCVAPAWPPCATRVESRPLPSGWADQGRKRGVNSRGQGTQRSGGGDEVRARRLQRWGSGGRDMSSVL